MGIGCDIVMIERVSSLIDQFGDKFLQRVYAKEEIIKGKGLLEKNREVGLGYFARRFAAKEAVAKALGTGIAKGLSFNEVAILNDTNGKPEVHLLGKSAKLVGNKTIEISLSDDGPFAMAFAVVKGA